MKFVFEDDDDDKKEGNHGNSQREEEKNNVQQDRDNYTNKTQKSSVIRNGFSSLDKARIESNNSNSSMNQQQQFDDWIDFSQNAKHSLQFVNNNPTNPDDRHILYPRNFRDVLKPHELLESGSNDHDDYEPLLIDLSSDQHQLAPQQRQVQPRNEGMIIDNIGLIGVSQPDGWLSNIEIKNNLLQKKSVDPPRIAPKQIGFPSSLPKYPFQENRTSSPQVKKQIGFTLNANRLNQQMSSYQVNEKPTDVKNNEINFGWKTHISSTPQQQTSGFVHHNTLQTIKNLQRNIQGLEPINQISSSVIQPKGRGFQACNSLKSNNENYQPKYQYNNDNKGPTSGPLQKNKKAYKQMMNRISAKIERSIKQHKEKQKNGFWMNPNYKQQLLQKQPTAGGSSIASGDGFQLGQSKKVYQQVLLQYYNSDLAKKAEKANGIDFATTQIPRCQKPQPNIILKKVKENDNYYGPLQTMRDQYFVDMLVFLRKGRMFTFSEMTKFDNKIKELNNKMLKFNNKLRPQKKKVGTTCVSNFSLRAGGIGSANPNPNQSYNSPNGGLNSSNASESNSVQGMCWDTNWSSDQYVLNLINAFKSQHNNQNPPNPKPSQFAQVPSGQSSSAEPNSPNRFKSFPNSSKRENESEYFERPQSESNNARLQEQNINLSQDEKNPGQQYTIEQDKQQKIILTGNQNEGREESQPRKNSNNEGDKTFFTTIAGHVKYIGKFLREKIFSYKNSTINQKSSVESINSSLLPLKNQTNR